MCDSFGDKHKDISLLTNTDSDIFTRELDSALLNNKGDIAVHSAKDLAIPIPYGLEVIALLEAFDNTDSLVSKDNKKLKDLPDNSKIGTSSQHRKEQLLRIRPELEIIGVRGTIEERLDLIDTCEIDALIVATCALKRLNYEHLITEILPFETHPLQGNLAVVGKENREDLKTIFSEVDIRKNYGKVYLTGFGPGNPELLTLKADKILNKADIIFYDNLVQGDHLNKYNAEKVYVGKRKGNHSREQQEINELICHAAQKGQQVVRLKGGDPLIFGRGGDEIDYLRQRLIDVEVIPGITSALAAAAGALIPLTQRGISSSVSFCTGHPEDKIFVPGSGTLVYYMGASSLIKIIKEVISHGWPAQTPVALVENASQPDQKIKVSTLQNIIKIPKTYNSPLTVIIGNTIKPERLQAQSLRKPKVLVTGTDTEKYKYLGEVIHSPLIQLRPLDSYYEFDEILSKVKGYDWIIFTSRYAVYYFFERLKKLDKNSRDISGCRVISIGNSTSEKLSEYGIVPDLQSRNESSNGIVQLTKNEDIRGRKILIPRSDIALNTLPAKLKKAGNDVTTVTIYRNVLPKRINKIDLYEVDTVVFTSPSCVRNFRKIYKNIPGHLKYIARGYETENEMSISGIK
jgi:uroporphyrinogen III methyltransferase/synthase